MRYYYAMGKKAIVYVPGLNDDAFLNRRLIAFLPIFWRKYGYEIYPVYPHWNKEKFAPKLQRIIKKIDALATKGYSIYLIGQSAGGSAVLNAFVEKNPKIKKVVNICGRLKEGKNMFPSLDFVARYNPAFKESVLLFENINENKLTKKDKEKILTIRPIWDETVPKTTVSLAGAKNIVIPTIEHSIGGIMALTIFSQKIREFFKH